MVDAAPARRPLATRGKAWAQALAGALARRRVAPNAISAASVVCAAGAAAALALWTRCHCGGASIILVAAAAGIQLRLLCNLLDGMVAIEGGLRSPTGDLWNEVPDRIADTLIIAAVGYGIVALPHAIELAWIAALLAMLTAYVRVLGASLGVPACFHGPMAKPHRMALLTAGCLASAIANLWIDARWILWGCQAVIALGSAITALRRLAAIARALRSRA